MRAEVFGLRAQVKVTEESSRRPGPATDDVSELLGVPRPCGSGQSNACARTARAGRPTPGCPPALRHGRGIPDGRRRGPSYTRGESEPAPGSVVVADPLTPGAGTQGLKGAHDMPLLRKWTEPSQKTTFAPPPWPLPYAPSRLNCKSRHGGLKGPGKGPATSEGVNCQLIGAAAFLDTSASKNQAAIWIMLSSLGRVDRR
jgi:hypothetical protein